MLNIYTSLTCKVCKKEFVLLTEDLEQELKKDRYIACPYCCSKRVEKDKISNSVKECMSERHYKRVKGRLRQK